MRAERIMLAVIIVVLLSVGGFTVAALRGML